MKWVISRGISSNGYWGIAIYDVRSGALEFDQDLPSCPGQIVLVDLDGDSVPEIVVTAGSSIIVFGHQPPVTAAVAGTTDAWRPSVFPNPSPSHISLAFDLDSAGRAQVQVFDVAGRLVRNLLDASLESGPHKVDWDGRDDAGGLEPAGIYFYRLSLNGKTSATNRAIRLQ
jgi:hypothetical protein